MLNYFKQKLSALPLLQSRWLTPPDADDMPHRQAHLDWLRIILFGLLIIHHLGMFYTANWGWHAKSQYRSEWLESVLLIVEPWRMPAIWLISGIAIRYVLAKVSVVRFVTMRSLRLLLPLLFGVLVIVPPQLYVEMTAKGEITLTYWQFLHEFFQTDSKIFANYPHGIWPHIDVNHLWYLRSLWFYSLSLLCILPLLNSQFIAKFTNWLALKHGALSLAFIILPVLLIQLFWESSNVRYPIGFTFLLLGYVLGWHQNAWHKIRSGIHYLLPTFLIVITLLVVGYNLIWLDVMKGSEASTTQKFIVMLVYSSARVIGVLTLLSLGIRFLHYKGKSLTYLSEAVYPFYILHQSIILVVGYQLTQHNLSAPLEATLLALLTVLLCTAFLEVIRRVDMLRPLFGLKMTSHYSLTIKRLGYSAGTLLTLPIAIELLI